MKYHIFDEREQFSEFSGGAISRWAANVLRNDADTHVVCVAADDSWAFPGSRICLIPELSRYAKLRARRFYPIQVNGLLLRSLYRKRSPPLQAGDVVWVHGQPDIALALVPWIRRAGAKLVLHLHGSLFVTTPASTMRAVSMTADKLVFCSSFLEQEARGKFPDLERTAILYNGADDALFYPDISNGEPERTIPIILVACRLIPEKGVHILIEAMRLLQKRAVPAVAKILGASFFGGSPPSAYIKQLHQLAPSNINLAGYYSGSDLADQFRQADIFCLPAIYNDPFPLAVIEGMASGLPVVSTWRGGIPEAFIDGGGVLVPPSSPAELADALGRLIANPELRRTIGQQGYESYKKHFTWRAIYARYHEILASL